MDEMQKIEVSLARSQQTDGVSLMHSMMDLQSLRNEIYQQRKTLQKHQSRAASSAEMVKD